MSLHALKNAREVVRATLREAAAMSCPDCGKVTSKPACPDCGAKTRLTADSATRALDANPRGESRGYPTKGFLASRKLRQMKRFRSMHEGNDCHDEKDGKFCSTGGGMTSSEKAWQKTASAGLAAYKARVAAKGLTGADVASIKAIDAAARARRQGEADRLLFARPPHEQFKIVAGGIAEPKRIGGYSGEARDAYISGWRMGADHYEKQIASEVPHLNTGSGGSLFAGPQGLVSGVHGAVQRRTPDAITHAIRQRDSIIGATPEERWKSRAMVTGYKRSLAAREDALRAHAAKMPAPIYPKLEALREANDCHDPADGKFCSGGGNGSALPGMTVGAVMASKGATSAGPDLRAEQSAMRNRMWDANKSVKQPAFPGKKVPFGAPEAWMTGWAAAQQAVETAISTSHSMTHPAPSAYGIYNHVWDKLWQNQDQPGWFGKGFKASLKVRLNAIHAEADKIDNERHNAAMKKLKEANDCHDDKGQFCAGGGQKGDKSKDQFNAGHAAAQATFAKSGMAGLKAIQAHVGAHSSVAFGKGWKTVFDKQAPPKRRDTFRGKSQKDIVQGASGVYDQTRIENTRRMLTNPHAFVREHMKKKGAAPCCSACEKSEGLCASKK